MWHAPQGADMVEGDTCCKVADDMVVADLDSDIATRMWHADMAMIKCVGGSDMADEVDHVGQSGSATWHLVKLSLTSNLKGRKRFE